MPRARRTRRTAATAEPVAPPPPPPPPGPPEGYVYNTLAGIWLAPGAIRWTSGVHHGPVTENPPPRQCADDHAFDPWSYCRGCVEFKQRAATRMNHALAYVDVCSSACAACRYGMVSTSTRHYVFKSCDRSSGLPICRACQLLFAQCSCNWCLSCEEPFTGEQSCGVCGRHAGCACTCPVCSNCDSRVESLCDVGGGLCRDCCGHYSCSYCGDHYDSDDEDVCGHGNCPRHSNSRYCGTCRSNNSFFDASDTMHRIALGPQSASLFERNPVRRLLGVEIEAYAREWKTVAEVVRKWGGGIVEDGSIQPVGGEGFEVTTAPAMGSLFVQQVEEITEAMKSHDVQTNASCGLHCHVDASSYKWWDVQKLIKLYAKVESELYAVCAPYRLRSNYSKTCGSRYLRDYVTGLKGPKSLKKKLLTGLYELGSVELLKEEAKGAVTRAYRQKYNQSRYFALNIHSWFRRGTIEFRHYHGTLNAQNIINWAIVCGRLVELAESMSDAEISTVTGANWLRSKMPPDVAKWMEERTAYMRTMDGRSIDEQQAINCSGCGYPLHSMSCYSECRVGRD